MSPKPAPEKHAGQLEGSKAFVAENRGSGLRQVTAQLRDAGMSPPAFDVRPAVMTVEVPQNALLDAATRAWLATIPGEASDPEALALAIMRHDDVVTNEMLRLWAVDRAAATTTLSGLVTRGLAVRDGGRRYASYRLTGSMGVDLFGSHDRADDTAIASDRTAAVADPSLAAVIEAIRSGKTRSKEIAEALGLTYATALRRLRKLKDTGLVEETQASRSTKLK